MYIVFQDKFDGFNYIPSLSANTLEKVLENIEKFDSQFFMFFIYKEHEKQVPLFGTRFDFYQFQKAVMGSKIQKCSYPIYRQEGHQYALTHQSSDSWVFTDKPFD